MHYTIIKYYIKCCSGTDDDPRTTVHPFPYDKTLINTYAGEIQLTATLAPTYTYTDGGCVVLTRVYRNVHEMLVFALYYIIHDSSVVGIRRCRHGWRSIRIILTTCGEGTRRYCSDQAVALFYQKSVYSTSTICHCYCKHKVQKKN